jgi:hypothetical protein
VCFFICSSYTRIWTRSRLFRPNLDDSRGFPGEVLSPRKHAWDRVHFNLLPQYILCKKVPEMVRTMGFQQWYCDNGIVTIVASWQHWHHLLYFHCKNATGTVPAIGSRKLDGENNVIFANIRVVQTELRVLGARNQEWLCSRKPATIYSTKRLIVLLLYKHVCQHIVWCSHNATDRGMFICLAFLLRIHIYVNQIWINNEYSSWELFPA